MVGGGVVVGFPLLTSFALTTAPASHGAVVIALLPAATATMAVLRGHERPPMVFWVIAGVGARGGDGLRLGAVGRPRDTCTGPTCCCSAPSSPRPSGTPRAACSPASSARGRPCPGRWSLCSPLMVFLAVWSRRSSSRPSGTPVQWAAFAYLGVVSMFLGFFAWYRGLAIGPMAQVSQVQLVQPVLSICWAGLLLGEQLTWTTILGGLVVILCAGAAVRVRLGHCDHDAPDLGDVRRHAATPASRAGLSVTADDTAKGGAEPLHSQRIAHPGACGKTPVVPQNRRPRPEPQRDQWELMT